MIHAKKRFLGAFTLLAVLHAGFMLCSSPESKNKNTGATTALTGTTWQRNDKGGNKINIGFGNNGEFSLHFHSVRMLFNGTYTQSGSSVRIVDEYCGTKLPGVFTYSIDKDTLQLLSVDDSLCERRKILCDGPWTPDTVDREATGVEQQQTSSK